MLALTLLASVTQVDAQNAANTPIYYEWYEAADSTCSGLLYNCYYFTLRSWTCSYAGTDFSGEAVYAWVYPSGYPNSASSWSSALTASSGYVWESQSSSGEFTTPLTTNWYSATCTGTRDDFSTINPQSDLCYNSLTSSSSVAYHYRLAYNYNTFCMAGAELVPSFLAAGLLALAALF